MKKNIFVTGVILFLFCSYHGNSMGRTLVWPDFDDSGILGQAKPDKTENTARMDDGVFADRRNDEETLSVSSGNEAPPVRKLVRDCYPDGNLEVGSACHEHYLGTQTEEILDREFSYVTPANDFKQSYVHPEPGVWLWERSDRWVNHCRENDQVIRLHAPISPQCSPWAKDDSRTAAELEQNLTEYMTAICKRYNDSSQVKWLDVVNETVYHTDGRWFGPDDGSDTWNNPWPRIGYDETHELRPPVYIKKAFEIANEYGSNIKLVINQHGGMEPFIWDKIKQLVAYLRENNLRVDGIGWQAHIWLGWEKQQGNMERLSELIDWCHANELEFHITEFNVWLKKEDLNKLTEQANTFYEITRLATEKHATGFVGINFWHIRGVETQNKDRDGGPWAENYEPKEAVFKIKEALCEASPVCRGECSFEPVELPEPKVIHQPKINQSGYLPESFKEFSVAADSVNAGQPFVVIDGNDNEVYSGALGNALADDSDISGEQVFKGNFSMLNIPGEYRVKTGNKISYPFEIDACVYDSLLNHVLRSFYLFRANDGINDPVTGLSHPEGHVGDAFTEDGDGHVFDLTGGWYNDAGYGKYVPSTAFTCAHLMNLYEVNPGYFKLQNLQIPESGNNLPDLLDQVKTGLEWMLKMQRQDGAVYHKLDSEAGPACGFSLDEDPSERTLSDPDNLSMVDAADFSAVMARAARLYAPFDSLFSLQCRSAALLSWEWVQEHMDAGQNDISFTDLQSWQEVMWAKAEVYMLTGDQTIAYSLYNDLNTYLPAQPAWNQPQLLGMVSLFHFSEIPELVKSIIRLRMENYAAQIKTSVDQSGYGTAIGKLDWDEGSNIKMANLGAVFTYAHQMTGDNIWLQCASQQLDYLLGRNSLNFSFVSGYGEKHCLQPFHWICKTYGIVPKGLLVKGAAGGHEMTNPDMDDSLKLLMKAGFPSAKTYIDTLTSAVSNEVTLCSVSSLAWLTGYLALHDREVNVNESNYLAMNREKKLNISVEDYSLFCSDCQGETETDIFSISGTLLKENIISADRRKIKLIDCGEVAQRHPVFLFRVTDETGRFQSGKVTSGL